MTGNIFIKAENKIESYFIVIEDEKLQKIIKEIDNWNGKGPLRKKKTTHLELMENKKIEIVRKKEIGFDENLYHCANDLEISRLYEYTYYLYNQHPLSIICEKLLTEQDPMVLSECYKNLIEVSNKSKQELRFQRKILEQIQIERLAIDSIIQDDDINIKEKRNFLAKFILYLKGKETKEILPDESFKEEIEKTIEELNPSESKQTKKRILSSLPTKNQIHRQNSF